MTCYKFVTLSVREGGVMLHARWVELPTTPTTGSSPGTVHVLSLVTRLRVRINRFIDQCVENI